MNLSIVIEQERLSLASGSTLRMRRCIVLDKDGCPVGELPITSYEQSCDPSSPVITTISTYRAEVATVDG